MRTAVVTIIAKNRLAQARVLMESVGRADPHFEQFVLLVDSPEDCFDITKEKFKVILSAELGIPKPHWFHFKYSILELSTAVKPFFLSWLFRNYSLDKIIYLDPDIRVYASLRGIEDALEHANIVLTPHLTQALDDDRQPSELQILRSGAYNLGFIGVSANPEVEKFLEWWQSHLYDHCAVDLLRGLFVDQRWIDLVPGMFSGVSLLRDTGYNAAYWNAAQREIAWRNGNALVGGNPLYFFHFSGYSPDAPEVLSRHQDRLHLKDRADLKKLCDQYRLELLARGFSDSSRWPYTHAYFRGGGLIPDVGRHLLDEAPNLMDEIDDPFSDEGRERIVRFWNAPVCRSMNGRSGVTKLAYRIYRLEEEVQAAMPDIFGSDYLHFLEWMLSRAPHEHLLSEPLLSRIHAAARDEKLSVANGRSDHAFKERTAVYADLLEAAGNHPPLKRLTKREMFVSTRVRNEGTGGAGQSSCLTILSRDIYESRPDLQRIFPDPQGRDKAAYVAWLLHYGRKNYALSEEYLIPLRDTLGLIRADLKLTNRMRLGLYCSLLRLARRISPLITAARNVRKVRFSWRMLRAKLNRFVAPVKPAKKSAPVGTFGVNVFGYFRAEMGVGQSARNGIGALTSAGMQLALQNLYAANHSELDTSIPIFSTSTPYNTNLYFVNADQTRVVRRGSQKSEGKHNIGFWTWELDELPREWDEAFDAYDEIWVPSSFCQATIAARAPVPVIRMPYCVKLSNGPRKTRQDLGIDPGRFVFLTVFDMRSGFERKNPLGAIRAFQEAFGGKGDCELIVKVNHTESSLEGIRHLRKAASGHLIRIIEETFRYEDVAALIGCCDCVVSMHRSEGFGMVLAEAMLMGKPVVATGYSGNLDFTTPNTAFLVSYTPRRVGPGNPPYPEHCWWADPCLKDAADQMRIVYEDVQLRSRRAEAGRILIETKFSSEAVGAAMGARLRLIEQRRSRTAGRN
jgi:glycosyltransferase involved in cell wall biosynthesis